MDRKAMLDLVRQAYAARDGDDLDGLIATFHPDAVFRMAGDREALAVAGSVQGHPKLRQALGGFIAGFTFLERTILSEVAEGDTAIVRSRLVVRANPKNMTRTTEVVDVMKFQDEKIIELIEFADTALIKDMLA